MKNELLTILSAELLKRFATGEAIQIAELNSATSLLIKNDIPFDLSYYPGTKRVVRDAKLVIYITPTTTITYILTFDGVTAPTFQ